MVFENLKYFFIFRDRKTIFVEFLYSFIANYILKKCFNI
jgi:hypothetical protein